MEKAAAGVKLDVFPQQFIPLWNPRQALQGYLRPFSLVCPEAGIQPLLIVLATYSFSSSIVELLSYLAGSPHSTAFWGQ